MTRVPGTERLTADRLKTSVVDNQQVQKTRWLLIFNLGVADLSG
jgi:hypothetical protein